MLPALTMLLYSSVFLAGGCVDSHLDHLINLWNKMSEVEVQSSLVKGPGGLYTLKDGTITSIADIQPQLLDFLYNIKNERLSDDLKQIERHTGIYREQLAYGIIGIIVIYLMVGAEAGLLCNLIGFLYPAIASCIAMEMDSRYDVFLWLLYWMCYGMLSIVDFYAETIMDVLPVYWLFKASFLLYLMLPQTNAIHNIYVAMIIPTIAAIEDFIMNYDIDANKRRRNSTDDDVDV